MTEHYEVIRQTLNLADTAKTCLEHLPQPLSNGDFELSIRLFQDFIQAFVQMNESMELLKTDPDVEALVNLSSMTQIAIIHTLEFMENKNFSEAQVSIENELSSSYNNWHVQLIDTFQSRISA